MTISEAQWIQVAVTIGSVAYALYLRFNTSHIQVDEIRTELIDAQEKKIKFLEHELTETKERVATLETQHIENKKLIEELYKQGQLLTKLLEGRDPKIKKMLQRSAQAIDLFEKETHPKVTEIHNHLLGGVEI